MNGLSKEVIKHKLDVKKKAKPVKQQKSNFASKRHELIKEEVNKLLDAKFIRKVMCPKWLAKMVLVKKANGKQRVCIDFTNLNKACPKDNYPLLRIAQLVNLTTSHELLSFLVAYSGYHHIFMAEVDREKTSFIIDQRAYYQDVMPFGLKNLRGTFQRIINKVFSKQIGKNVKAYIDDIVVKSEKAEEHVNDL